jgi:aminoglycoside phosphotransferase (APT) family kinase protein
MNSNNDLQLSEINKLLNAQDISAGMIELYQKKDRIVDYLIDDKYILRLSKSELSEEKKHDRVKSIALVPKIHSSGSYMAAGCNYYFMITDYMQGHDLYNVLQSLTDEQSIIIGREIACFLNELHSISGSAYDIGHYIPTVPGYTRSWKEGHMEYVNILRNGLTKLNLNIKSKQLISLTFDYIDANINCLEYQTGAKILHNDFHPKNIIIHKAGITGIIDWECSQFGEPDFEMAHLFHWCIYPPDHERRFELLLKTIYENLWITNTVPDIAKRLTIYQLEHELNQLIWHGLSQEEERMLRIKGWLNGQIEQLIENFTRSSINS